MWDFRSSAGVQLGETICWFRIHRHTESSRRWFRVEQHSSRSAGVGPAGTIGSRYAPASGPPNTGPGDPVQSSSAQTIDSTARSLPSSLRFAVYPRLWLLVPKGAACLTPSFKSQAPYSISRDLGLQPTLGCSPMGFRLSLEASTGLNLPLWFPQCAGVLRLISDGRCRASVQHVVRRPLAGETKYVLSSATKMPHALATKSTLKLLRQGQDCPFSLLCYSDAPALFLSLQNPETTTSQVLQAEGLGPQFVAVSVTQSR